MGLPIKHWASDDSDVWALYQLVLLKFQKRRNLYFFFFLCNNCWFSFLDQELLETMITDSCFHTSLHIVSPIWLNFWVFLTTHCLGIYTFFLLPKVTIMTIKSFQGDPQGCSLKPIGIQILFSLGGNKWQVVHTREKMKHSAICGL